ncbi:MULTISPECIES: YcaO-like family protein [Streptomyces]|uniref:YcaO-like family protein n=1 Tax=Streptomyces ramulosus TaxID=47762 RepID=A0ABW1FDS3_9ACTN
MKPARPGPQAPAAPRPAAEPAPDARGRWSPQVFSPFPHIAPRVLFARIAARSPLFDATSAAGGAAVLVGSSAGDDPAAVAVRARGELFERMSNVLTGRRHEKDPPVVAAYRELRRRGRPALDPAALTRSPGMPGETLEALRSARQLWLEGRSLLTGAPLLVPAGAACLHHRPPPGCVATTRCGSTGVAAHRTFAAAAGHAAWEILERDLIRRSWYGPDSPAPTALSTPDLPAPLTDLLTAGRLRCTALDLPAPAGARCIVACLHRTDGTGQAFGARCGPARDPAALVERAAYEATMIHWSVGSAVARRTWDSWAGGSPPRSALQHALWAYHRQDSLRIWLDGAAPRSRSGVAPPGPPAEPDGAVGLLSGHSGEDVIAVETTAPFAREAGQTVVRLIAPGTFPLPSGPGDPHHAADRTVRHRGEPHPFG